MPFLVIFDVSQLADYYADVHNILALPSGATYRYEYSRKYLTDPAAELASAGASQPTPALLLYEQKNCSYVRTSTEAKPLNLSASSVYVATRLGTVVNVTIENDRYFFDIQVGAYPSQNAADLNAVLNSLNGCHPWSVENGGFAKGKFVCVSDAEDAYRRLHGTEETNWTPIINALSDGTMQFAGDVFWRLKGLYKGASQSKYPPKVVMHLEANTVRRADTVYEMPRGQTWRFELVSDVGKQVAGRPQYESEVISSDETAVRLVGGSRFFLRRYTSQMIQFRSESAEKFGTRTADLSFTTLPKLSTWPSGPTCRLQFRTRENYFRLSVGIIAAVVGTAIFILGKTDLMKDYKGWAAILQISGALLDLVAAALLIRRVSLPGGG